MNNEKIVKPINGWIGILAAALCLTVAILGLVNGYVVATALIGVALFMLVGSVIVAPKDACVLIFFGRYKGTIKENGFYWVNPLTNRRTVSQRPRHFTSIPIRTNDKAGTPIVIGLVLVWNVEDTYKAAFEVDDYQHFVIFQSDAALLKLADSFHYNNIEVKDTEFSLIAGSDVVNKHLEEELRLRLQHGGISIVETRVNYLTYGTKGSSAKRKKKNGGKQDRS